MRPAARLGWFAVALVTPLVADIAWGQYLPVPGPGPIAAVPVPAVYTPQPTDTPEPPPPRGYAEDIGRAKQEAASVFGIAPGSVQYDQARAAGTGWAQPLSQLRIQQAGEPEPSAPALITDFNGIDFTGSFPPDPVVAAGPTSLVLVTNGSATIRTKTGALVASTTLVSFFGSVRASGESAFDPKVVYDVGSSRFFLLAVGRITDPSCTPGTCVSHFFLAVSKSSSPASTGSTDWFFYAFDATLDGGTATANWADYPGLGVDSTAVVLTANMFTFSTPSTFQRAKIRILDKSLLLTGAAVTWTDFFGMMDPSTGFLSFTLRPALTFGIPGIFFLVSASSTSGSCDLVVWGIMSPLSSPTLAARTATAGGTCLNPPDAQQQGGGTPLDTGDKRLQNAVYRNASIWTGQAIQMNFGSGNVSAVRWVQINVSSWPTSVSLTQDSTFGADATWYFYPAVMVDGANNLGMILARASASEFGSAYYTGRLATDAANTLQPSAILRAGAANQNLIDSFGRNRYGDYLGIAQDPSDGSFWVLGEYVVSANAWGTWVGNVALSSSPNTAPFGSLDWPTSGTALAGTVMLPGWALDRETDATALTLALLIDGVATTATPARVMRNDVCAVFSATTYPGACQSGYQFSLNTSTLSSGSHTLAVQVTDTGGLTATLGPVTVTIGGNTPPFGSLDWPLPGTTLSGTVVLPGWVLDPQTNASALSLALLIDGAATTATPARVMRNDVCAVFSATTYPGACQSGYQFSWNTTGLSGSHTVAVQVTDVGGLTTTLGPVTVTIGGNTPPFGSLDWPPPGTTLSGTVVLPGWVLDQQTNASALSLALLVDGMTVSTSPTRVARPDVCVVFSVSIYPGACQSGYQFSLNTSTLSSGSHTLAVQVTDAGGLTATLGNVTVTVGGNTPPSGSLDWPPPGTTLSGTVIIPGWALDRETMANALTLALLVDGTPVSAPLTRVMRNDVCAVFSATIYPGACQSGYQFSLNTAALTAGSHTLAVQVTDAGGLTATLGPVTVTVQPNSQVRFFNNLCLAPSCTPFTVRLTASQGYTWFSTSGTYSAYQTVTTSTLSNFQGEAVGFGTVLTCSTCTFNLTSGRRYAIWVTLDPANNIILALFDEGAMNAVAPQIFEVPAQAFPAQRQGDPAIRFAPAQEAPAPR